MTDMTRLHKVASMKKYPRGCGLTTLKIHEIVSCVELGLSPIICEISKSSDMNYLKPMMVSIFAERGIPWFVCHHKLSWIKAFNNIDIYFVPTFQLQHHVLGYKEHVMIDLTN
jgi:hypothetical protein